MRSLSILAAAAAAVVLPSAVLAAPEPGTLQLDFHKRKTEASPARLGRRQTSNTVNTAISNEQILYLINVTVGTPPQSIGLQLDTGSSDIWFPASNSRICQQRQCIVGSYDGGASSTFNDPNLPPFQIAYVDGTQIEGQYISDTLSVGGATLTNLTMASATSTGNNFYGIMGIGFSSDESSIQAQTPFTYPNIIDVLVSEGKIAKRAYSLWLDDVQSNTGSILFGGVDKNKYTGNLIAIPIQKDSQSGNYTSMTVAWTGLTVTGGGQTSNFNPSTPQPAILDSGTTDLLLPDDIAQGIFNGVGMVVDRNYGNLVPCDLANDDLSFSFQFGGNNGPRVNVSVAEFVTPLITANGHVPKFRSGPYNGKNACQFGIEAAGSAPILFGDTFLRSAYVVYDLDNLQIGLAQTNRNADTKEDQVQAFSSGTIMPDATTTVNAVTVSASGGGNSGPQVQTTASGTADAGDGATYGSATFSLVAATASGSSTSNAAAPVTIPSVQKSTFAVIGVTVAAFFLGAALF